MKAQQTIKARQTQWGNWNCYIGTRMVYQHAREWYAQEWINDHMSTGLYKLSPKSQLQPQNAANY